MFTFYCGLSTYAEDIANILHTIEQNNSRLKALRQTNDATVAEKNAENTIGATSVEYTPFFQKGADGVASSELIVSQEFDFPTLYAARNKSARLQQDILKMEYEIARRDIFIEAANLYYDLMTATENKAFISQRLAATDSLLKICDIRLRQGDATIIEQNRIRMDRMNIKTEMAQNEGTIETIKLNIERLGGTSDVTVSDIEKLSALIQESLEETYIEKQNLSAGQELNLAKQDWLPRLTVGYRRNTELREYALNGVLVGVALPIFSNSKKVKAARMRKEAMELEMENLRNETESHIRSLRAEAATLKAQLSTYDTELMQQTLSTLMRAVTAGQLSITEYYTEANRVYQSQQERLATQSNYHKVVSELRLRGIKE